MKKVLGYAKYVFFFLIGVGLLWLAFRSQDPDVLMREFLNAEYSYVVYAVLAGIASTISRAFRWNMLIRPFGYNVSAYRSLLALMTGYLANLAVPRMGEITRCVVVNQTDKVPVNKLFGTVVAERAMDLLAVFILVLFVLVFEWNRITDFFTQIDFAWPQFGDLVNQVNNPWIITAPALAIIAILAGLFFAIYRLGSSLFMYKLKNLARGFWDGMVSIKNVENPLYFILHSIFIWAMYILMTYLCFYAIATTSHLGISAAFFVMVVGTFGFIAPVQGGIGAYHWLVQESLVLYGIPRSDGLVFATIVHAAQTIYILILGSLCMLIFIFYFRKKLSNVKVEQVEEENPA